MYHTLDEFCADFTEDLGEIGKNFAVLTDAALDTRAADGLFSLRELARHMLNAWPGVLAQAGRPIDCALLPADADAAALAAGCTQLRERLPAALRAGWTDATLAEPIELWGMHWTHAKLLWEMQKHTVHHHGQLTVLLRLAGLPVHGVYGPSRDEMPAAEAATAQPQ